MGLPSWFPDGTKNAFTTIAFTKYRDSNHEIYVMNADGSERILLTKNSAMGEPPFWSPLLSSEK